MTDSCYFEFFGKNIYLEASAKGLTLLSFDHRTHTAQEEITNKHLQKAKRQIEEYFNGRRKYFDLDLDLRGTEFQISVWQALQSIPFAKTISYKDLALKISKPKAVRAVGNANAKNSLPLIIPCHRVILSDGKLGGYSGGRGIKSMLINFELGQ